MEEFKKERKEKRKGKREEDGSKKSVKLIASNRGEGGGELDLSKILTSKRKKKEKKKEEKEKSDFRQSSKS